VPYFAAGGEAQRLIIGAVIRMAVTTMLPKIGVNNHKLPNQYLPNNYF
jgi:hypothetical protein